MPPISPDRWRLLSPHLDEALEMTGAERTAWLQALRARDEALADDLAAILDEQAHVEASGFLQGSVVEPSAGVPPSPAGQVFGAYRLVAQIGHGGMGTVWRAERCDGRFKGTAAVKLLNVSLIGRAGEERFRREGSFLARVRHPRIAHLIDAGVSPAGQPYLVLEYVDGRGIDRYCDERMLTIDARLRLFLEVLDAVAHAHANLVVHRDIKPANVLVSVDGQVKLLDFGIAKLIDPDNETGTAWAAALTRDAGPALTPEFAAPEQLCGGAVTTGTDVYALGVLLYVLLTGRHPAGRAVETPATLIRAIVETEPMRASDAVVAPAERADDLARHAVSRATSVPRLRRALRGDLDTIVSKALKKNSAERYASVTELADDVRRYLRHEPIGARPDTVAYRLATFARRHTAGVTTFAVVALLIATMTAVYTNRLSAERDRAQRETSKAVKVSELLTGLLTSADPYADRASREPTVRGLLDAGADRVMTQLAAEPDLQAEMLTMMGRTYRRLGVYDKAHALLERALESGERAFGPEHAHVALTLHDLGVLLADNGDYPAAARSLERALDMRRRLLGQHHADVAVTLVELGRVYQDVGSNGRAEPLQREALFIRRKALGEGDAETAVSLSDLASVLRLNGDLAGAERLLRQCLEINRKARGEDHPNTLMTLHDLALIAAARGDHSWAESQFRYVLAAQRRALGEQHPILAMTLNNLARPLPPSERYDEAADALRDALDIARPRLRPEHPLVAIYSAHAASVALARKRPADAEPLLREAVRIRELAPSVVAGRRRILPDDDWNLGVTRSLLGAALSALGRYDEAEAALLAARQDLDALPTPRQAEIRANHLRLADLYAAWGKREKAASFRALLRS